MAKPRVLVLRAPGTNCDYETEYAFERVGGDAERIHVNRLLENPQLIDAFQILCVPGGFSYGDDIAAGKVLAVQMQTHLSQQLAEFQAAGKLLLGICNGFQVLLKSGLLFADPSGPAEATLTWNDNGRYEARWVHLSVESQKCIFLRGIETMYLPVAHAEGKVVFRGAAEFERFGSEDRIALRYTKDPFHVQRCTVGSPATTASARLAVGSSAAPTSIQSPSPIDAELETVPYPFNPNGSESNVAGVCDPTGRVFGLMPHPERFIEPTQHPRWTREGLLPEGGGLQIFRNAVEFFG